MRPEGPWQRWWAFLNNHFPWRQTDRASHSRAPIHRLWEEVGNISGKRMPEDRQRPENSGYPPKSRGGFRYRIREAKAKPRNKAIRELLGNDAYTEAVLSFLRKTDAGKAKEGVLDRGVG